MQKQYGTIPFIRGKNGIEVVLITSASGYWIFPKGQYEKRHGKRGTAKLEAFEEAGLKGKIFKEYAYRTKVIIRSGEQVQLTLYAFEVQSFSTQWKEERRRERRLVSIDDAKKLITSDKLMKCLEKFERDFVI
ncbi:NUDIX domain-containing protein [Pontiellaceae bacterium B12219]|nr:NUDIX domain-containing protein [Pontiellaceae bacterium B12219]